MWRNMLIRFGRVWLAERVILGEPTLPHLGDVIEYYPGADCMIVQADDTMSEMVTPEIGMRFMYDGREWELCEDTDYRWRYMAYAVGSRKQEELATERELAEMESEVYDE